MRQRRLSTIGFPAVPKARGLLRRGMFAVLGCLALMALGAAPALATPEWSSTVNLVEPLHYHYAEEPQIALDAKGDAVAVWHYEIQGGSTVPALTQESPLLLMKTPQA